MGQVEYGLKSLADDQLLSGLASIVDRRNQITAEFLAYLAELDARQLFLDLGFSSLFEYCVEELKLCESTAGRHIAAARVCRDHPEVFGMVASGALHASALSLMKKHLTAENARELFESCSHRSARQVEVLLATRFPRPDVRDLVRRLPARVAFTPDVGCSTEASQSRRLEPLSADRYGIHFTADGEFCELLERVRGLAGHRLPSGDLMTVLKHGLEAYERELEKERFAVGSKARRNREVPAPSPISMPDLSAPELPATAPVESAPQAMRGPRLSWKRHCPAAVVQAVYLRDGKQCSYVSPSGRRCSARRCLELDHIEPLAVGGEGTIENLRLRCRAHNQRYARQYFGASRVEAAIRRSRRREEALREA